MNFSSPNPSPPLQFMPNTDMALSSHSQMPMSHDYLTKIEKDQLNIMSMRNLEKVIDSHARESAANVFYQDLPSR